ncbi:MAG: hypothetical protein AUK51_01155 [Comamonadaceae bacterium CG2_30_59_20]|nr:MAG: hypothetical protein AUK51_01155 [Comamonadaceae bacterium CG2_30_59_20]
MPARTIDSNLDAVLPFVQGLVPGLGLSEGMRAIGLRSQGELIAGVVYAGFTWDGSTFYSDATSQNRITGAVTLAQLSSAFTIDWTLADNTVRNLGQMDMFQVGAALGVHVQTQFAKGQALRAQIDAATTQAEVEAVVW